MEKHSSKATNEAIFQSWEGKLPRNLVNFFANLAKADGIFYKGRYYHKGRPQPHSHSRKTHKTIR